MIKPKSQVLLPVSAEITLGPMTISAVAMRRLVISATCIGVALVAIADLLLPKEAGALRYAVAGVGLSSVGLAMALNSIHNHQSSKFATPPASPTQE